MGKINKLSCGLFRYKGIYFWRNIFDVKTFLQRVFFTLKHGYSPMAQWETFAWFISVMQEIFSFYRHNRTGDSWIIGSEGNPNNEEDQKKNAQKLNELYDKMIMLLMYMDEQSPFIADKKYNKQEEIMHTAKEEFFQLFSEYFYTFWD